MKNQIEALSAHRTPNILGDKELAELAMDCGLLEAGEPMTDGLRKFALALVEHCAVIGEPHQDPLSDGTAGDHIRAMFGMH